MTTACPIDQLLNVLESCCPKKVDELRVTARLPYCGLHSVGLKLHCLELNTQFDSLIEQLGARSRVASNLYRQRQASLCLVLPAVGSADAAITLLHCLEQYTHAAIFGNPSVQLQVCSPFRLSAGDRISPRLRYDTAPQP
jgi:hypothetical protein